MTQRFGRLVLACTALWFVLASYPVAQRAGYQVFSDPDKRFSVEYPRDWTWLIVAGSSEPIIAFTQPRKEAAVVVERFRLRQALAGDEVTELFAMIEADVLRENQPRATNIDAKVVTGNGRKLILIDYTRPGGGTMERVRQYSYPVGKDLYRITCMAVNDRFDRYESFFESIASSIKPGA